MNGQAPALPMQIDVAAAFANTPAPLDFVWPGYLAGSVGAFAAPGGAGKSFWALAAAMSVACDILGGDILELGPSDSGRVVYLAAEDPEPVLNHRLYAIGAHLPPAARASIASHLTVLPMVGSLTDVMNPRWLKIIVDACMGARLLVIDVCSLTQKLTTWGPSADQEVDCPKPAFLYADSTTQQR